MSNQHCCGPCQCCSQTSKDPHIIPSRSRSFVGPVHLSLGIEVSVVLMCCLDSLMHVCRGAQEVFLDTFREAIERYDSLTNASTILVLRVIMRWAESDQANHPLSESNARSRRYDGTVQMPNGAPACAV